MLLSPLSRYTIAGTFPVQLNNNPLPQSGNLVVDYNIANTSSYSGAGGTSIVSIGTPTNTATITGSPTYTNTQPINLQMTGSSVATLTGSTTAYFAENIVTTISYWFKFDSLPTSTTLLTELNYTDNPSLAKVFTSLQADGKIFYRVITPAGFFTLTSNTVLSSSRWNMVTYNIQTQNFPSEGPRELYINGVADRISTYPNSNNIPRKGTILIPMANNIARWTRYQQWNTRLSAYEILGMYNGQKGYYGL